MSDTPRPPLPTPAVPPASVSPSVPSGAPAPVPAPAPAAVPAQVVPPATAPVPTVPGTGTPATPPPAPAAPVAEPSAPIISTQGRVTGVQRPAIPTLHDLLGAVITHRGSDLHVPSGSPIKMRVHGELRDLLISDMPLTLSGDENEQLLKGVLSTDQAKRFEEGHELDFAYSIPGLARFRVNYHYSKGLIGATFRIIPETVLSIDQLGLPEVVRTLAHKPRGLVLVTGPTGSGKSTTLAAMIDMINRSRKAHILTIEDPIEFVHSSKECLVTQRELGSDTYSFAAALKHALRQDPDVILVGEMRDAETMELAIAAAETGHLVFATLHTQDAPQTVDRIIQNFPPLQQNQIRAQLSMALEGVITQQLVPTVEGDGRVAACEVMVCTPGIRNQIRDGQTAQLYSSMQSGASDGMQTMETSLAKLVSSNKITMDTARKVASKPDELKNLQRSMLRS